MILTLAAIAAVSVGIYWAVDKFDSRSAQGNKDVYTAVAVTMTLRDKVIEGGELESQSTITANCEIDSWDNKLIFLAPEGSIVEKGQVVARFDRSEADESVARQEAEVNEEQTDVDNAEQELKVQKSENEKSILAAEKAEETAKLDLEKYLKGDYVVQLSDLKGAISESSTAVEKARRDLEVAKALVKGGFTDYGSLREAEQVVKSAQLRYQRDVQKLDTLEKYEHVKSKAEFEGKYESAKSDNELAKTTAKAKLKQAESRLQNEKEGLRIDKRRLKEAKLNQKRHTMHAPRKGTLLYAKDRYSSGEKLHEGSVLYKNQPVFVLPDMTRMQVKVGVHESLVGKIKKGQPALVRVDAYSADTLKGKVESVALLSDSRGSDPSNTYSVIVKIESFPKEAKLKPGMSANVEILVGTYPDVLGVPIQAITSFGRKKFVFVKNEDNEFERREVTLGESNTSFVAIETGLEADEVVALDAYQRGLTEFGDEDPEEEEEDELAALADEGEEEEASNESLDDEPPTPRDSEDSDAPSADEQAEGGSEDASEGGLQPGEDSEKMTEETPQPEEDTQAVAEESEELTQQKAEEPAKESVEDQAEETQQEVPYSVSDSTMAATTSSYLDFLLELKRKPEALARAKSVAASSSLTLRVTISSLTCRVAIFPLTRRVAIFPLTPPVAIFPLTRRVTAVTVYPSAKLKQSAAHV